MRGMRWINLFFLSLFFVLITGCSSTESPREPSRKVLVTVAPYRQVVEILSQGKLDVEVLVPAGANVHDFEPTPRQVIGVSQVDLWFRVGEAFEGRVQQSLESHRQDLVVHDLRKGLSLRAMDETHGHSIHCSHAHGLDLHIWLSPRMMKLQAHAMTEALIDYYPDWADIFRKGLDQLLKDLDAVDEDIREILRLHRGKVLLVGHPAFGYFCDDYELRQIPLECAGSDPTPQALTSTLQLARKHEVRHVYTQPQFSPKGPEMVARELRGRVIEVDPYREDYLENLRDLARAFAGEETR